jgi:hypothetical protein
VKPDISSYADCYAAQVGALGIAGQRRLQRSTVLIVGAGGVGTAITTVLATTGVGRLVIVDPQRVEVDNLNRYPFVRPRDIGRPKVDVVTGFFEGRPHLAVIPIVERAENIPALRIADDVHLVVSAANTVPARLAVACLAVRQRLAHVAAAVADGREGRGGLITGWAPERPELACPGCFLDPHARPPRGESLLAPVVSVVGALAACFVVEFLLRERKRALDDGNYVSVNLDPYAVERLRVGRRDDCPACGRVGRRISEGKRQR